MNEKLFEEVNSYIEEAGNKGQSEIEVMFPNTNLEELAAVFAELQKAGATVTYTVGAIISFG